MTTRRIAKITSAIREQVSTSILFDLKDPRVKNITVTSVEVSPDAQHAHVKVSILGDEKDAALCLHGLNSARGFLQAKVAARIQTRYTPLLSFEIDSGIKHSVEVSRILAEIPPPADEPVDEEDPLDATVDDERQPAPPEVPG